MLLVFDIVLLFLLRMDTRLYKRMITPFSVFASVNLVLINLNNLLIAHIYDFYTVSADALFLLTVFMTVIFGVDYFCAKLFFKLKDREFPSLETPLIEKIIGILYLIGFAALVGQFVILLVQYGLGGMKGRASGILAHVSKLCLILAPFFLDFALKSKNKMRIWISLGMAGLVLLLLVLNGGKYPIMIHLLYFALYFFVSHQEQINLKKLLIPVAILSGAALVVFIIIYFLVPVITGSLEEGVSPFSAFAFSIKHLFDYLLGPVIANNFTLANPGAADPAIPFTVPANIIQALLSTQEYVDPIHAHIMPLQPDIFTNVSGLVGETVYCLGYANAAFYLIGIFAIVNVFYILYRKYSLYRLTCNYLLCLIILGFFCNFFTVSGALLPLIYLFILETGLYIFRHILTKRGKKT